MRKHFRKILTIITAMLFALPILLITVSCASVDPRSVADVIPASLGDTEGFWMYKGNMRTRTDGTEEEKLLTSVTVDETEYGEDEFKIVKYKYVRGTYEIFCVIKIEEDIRLYHYNYFMKTSSDLYDLPDVEDPNDYKISVSNSLVYVSNANKSFGLIFSRTAQLLYEDFYGKLDGDIVYRLSGGTDFTWIKDGEKHDISLSASFSYSDCVKNGKYVYFFGATPVAVNIDTEDKVTLSAFEIEGGTFRMTDSYLMGGSLYVVANYVRNRNTEDEERLYRFICVKGMDAETVYDFGDVPYGVTMRIDGSTIYLEKGAGRDRQKKYFAYDAKTHEMESVSNKEFKTGKTTEDIKKEQASKNEKITVGDYTFYVTSIGYDSRGSYYDKTCYYLMRKCGDFEEVIQYSLNGNGGYFYDDICEV